MTKTLTLDQLTVVRPKSLPVVAGDVKQGRFDDNDAVDIGRSADTTAIPDNADTADQSNPIDDNDYF